MVHLLNDFSPNLLVTIMELNLISITFLMASFYGIFPFISVVSFLLLWLEFDRQRGKESLGLKDICRKCVFVPGMVVHACKSEHLGG
jgi:hypothetical protein